MMFCGNCCVVFDTKKCPHCGNVSIREPLPDDFCLLTEKEMPWSEMLADILKQNQIPVFTKRRMGAGMALRVGPMFESVKFYVPYSHFSEATGIVESLFSDTKTGKE